MGGGVAGDDEAGVSGEEEGGLGGGGHGVRLLLWIMAGGALAPQAHDAPNGHGGVEDDGGPKGDADEAWANAGECEERGDGEVIERHGGDQGSCGGTLGVVACEPVGDAEGEQGGSGDASECDGCGCVERWTKEEWCGCGGAADQSQTGSRFDECGDGQQSIHGCWSFCLNRRPAMVRSRILQRVQRTIF